MAFIEFERSVRENDWSMHDLHSHPHYEIYLLSQGSRSFFLSDALYKVTAPVLIIIPPHVMHKTEGGSFERYNINVSANYLDPFQREILDSQALRIIQPRQEETENLIALMREAIGTDKRSKHAEYVLKTLFSYSVLTMSKLSGAYLQPTATAKNDMPPLVLKVVDHLNNHYSEKQTLEELAEYFFVSKATLIYNFKKYTNCSLIDFLLNVRLTKAKEMLLNTRKSVNEIAECCGFSSANYFGLVFKKKENISPANYRKNERAKS